MKKWILLFLLLSVMTSWGQYTYTYTDPCTLQFKSVYVPAGGGVMVNYFNNNSTFTTNDFSSGAFDSWLNTVSQQNSNSPCQSVTTAIVNNVTSLVVNNTVTIVTNVTSIASLAQSMASIGSSVGGAISSTASGVSDMGTGGSTNENSKNENQKTSNTSTRTDSGSNTGSQSGNQNQGSQTTPNTTGGTPSTTGPGNTDSNQSTPTGSQQTESPIGTPEAGATSGGTGNTANSVSNSVDGGSSDGSSSGGGKKQSNAKSSSGSLIASGDMVIIAPADKAERNQIRVVGSITHANTRGTRIKGVLFNFQTVTNNTNVTFYKSWINKSKKLNTIAANSTMMDFDKNIFNTTTLLESYKYKKVTGMFGMNFTVGKMGERGFYNMSAVAGGHGGFPVSKRISTSILVLGIYSPFTQFYEGKWWDAGILIVPFNSWDIKITKTFKYNISATAVYSYGENFLNYQILTGGKMTF